MLKRQLHFLNYDIQVKMLTHALVERKRVVNVWIDMWGTLEQSGLGLAYTKLLSNSYHGHE